ncbi:Serine hydrolase FSH [Penicillium longicatenatum]|uniref:Serine hydrolase FSH n=1 Tax=Penicillium longicatenatum TaxID=1561947 RepID=UPI002546FFCB|nr:Serine hydrolase FSH [Penicillium longicatenatum]KAJ5650651.1 Serine hydrolase FSH [Penicillium longicatenatum]
MQTARIREELDGHEFVFIDGMVSTEPIAGATALAEECYGYLPSRVDPSQCYDMVAGLVQYVQSQGPFDGVMGFSEGGIVAAMLLVEDARYPFAGFKCGIFFSAALPLDPDVVRTGIVRCIDPVADGVLLHIPTTVVIEENLVRLRDRSPLAPLWLQEDAQEALIQICDEASREVVRHNLGHHVPGSKSVEKLAETLQAIERTIERAGDIFS